MARKSVSKPYTDERGKFAPGSPGKPKGTRHKVTRAVEELLGDQSEALTQKAVELALEGDTGALRLCMERIAPPRKDSPVSFAQAQLFLMKVAAGLYISPHKKRLKFNVK